MTDKQQVIRGWLIQAVWCGLILALAWLCGCATPLNPANTINEPRVSRHLALSRQAQVQKVLSHVHSAQRRPMMKSMTGAGCLVSWPAVPFACRLAYMLDYCDDLRTPPGWVSPWQSTGEFWSDWGLPGGHPVTPTMTWFDVEANDHRFYRLLIVPEYVWNGQSAPPESPITLTPP